MTEANQRDRVRIWDLPTRLSHWLLVVLVGFSWWSGDTHRIEWHKLSGYCILTLMLFRLYWSVAGSTTARFAHFIRGPRAVWAYARTLFKRSAPSAIGHNVMGGWSVIAMIALLLTQTLLGLFAVDVDGIQSGPLSHLVSFDVGRTFAGLHGLLFNVLLGLIGLHVLAIAFYALYKRENLIGAMLSGQKQLPAETRSDLRFSSSWHALLAVSAAAILVAYIVGYL